MKLYTAKVNLHGSDLNQVLKHDLTAAEIIVLKRIHGGDAVIDIIENSKSEIIEIKQKPGGDDEEGDIFERQVIGTRKGDVDRTDEQERKRLNRIYGQALRTIKGVGTIEAVLGVDGVPLPQYVTGIGNLPKATGKMAPKGNMKDAIEAAKEEAFA